MKNAMKKIIAVGCAVALMLSFAACGKKADDKETTTAKETTTVAETTATGETTTAAPVATGEISDASTKEQIAAYYNTVLNATKQKGTLKGTEQPLGINLTDLGSLSANFVDMINKAVPGIVDSVFKPGSDKSLPVLNYDNDKDVIQLLPEDIKEFKVVDKGTTLELTITPEAVTNPAYGKDAQGRFFQILGDVQSVVDQISQIKFESGVQQGLTLTYQNGTGKIVVDKASGLVTSADYNMHVDITVKDVKALSVIKISSGSIAIDYTTLYK